MTSHTYVKQIVKKVKCSRSKRQEIYRQLLADINQEMENGVPFDVVMLRMGEPIAIAEEFNQNLSQTEHKKYKNRLAAKIIAGIAVMLAGIIAAALWFLPLSVRFGNSGLFSEAVVEEQSKEVIRMLNEEDYEALKACTDERVQQILTQQVIEDAKKQAGTDWGEFQQFGKCYMSEQKLQGRTRAVVQINAAYEKIGVTYTLFFNDDMKLSGLYIK